MEFIQVLLLIGILALLLEQRKPKANTKGRKIVLDTCALMDGRIVDLTRSGFAPDELIIPEFVLHEMQMLADGSDAHKRDRARFGLDVVRELQDSRHCTVTVDPRLMDERKPTDDRLVSLAQMAGAQLYTTDFNLQKVAEIKGVSVLNVNQLAQNVRSAALPGERKKVKILQKGSNRDQGVGYLEDGTMIVVDGGAKYIGKTLDLEVTRIHQTASGKMLFGQIVPKQSDRTAADQSVAVGKSLKTKPTTARTFPRLRSRRRTIS